MARRLATLLAAATLIAAPAPYFARPRPDPDRAAIDRYLRAEMAARHVPGLQVVISRAHRIIFSASYGLADVATGRPVDSATSFEIASMTKQFTDAAVLLLAEDGKLALDDPISRYLPGLPDAWQSITIRQLMTHTAGLRDDWDEDDAFFQTRMTDSSFLAALESAPLRFPPGTGFSYGCGPFVLGLLVTRLTGMPYPTFMRQRIFRPLGLNSTGTNEVDGQTDSATGYRWQHDSLTPGVRISAAAHARGDVGIHSTALDLARWDAALDGDHFLTAASRRTMFSAAHLTSGAVVPYGLGWFIRPWRGRREIEHDGGFRTGFSSTIARYPEDSLTIILLTNRQSAHAYSIVRGLMGLFDADFTPITRMAVMRGDWPLERAAVRRTFDAIGHGRPARDLDSGALLLTGTPLDELRRGLEGYANPELLGCRPIHRPRTWHPADRGTEVCFVRAASPAGSWWSFTFDRRHRITYFEPEE